ncbi:MAG: hypothetical protein KY442_10180, partial [Proteobacteria bacterium]|nr:hypothetical protein [Pseudomonadota bacterium]
MGDADQRDRQRERLDEHQEHRGTEERDDVGDHRERPQPAPEAQVRGVDERQGEVTNSLWTHMIQSMSDQVRSGQGQETFGPLSEMLQGMGAPMDEGESELDLVQQDAARRSAGLAGGGPSAAGPGGMPLPSFSGPIPELLGPVRPGEDGVPHGL